jgi:hypothetical protein
MSVPLVSRWQFHVVAISDATQFFGIGRTFEGVTFKDKRLVG